jgi:hypothetical protein
MVVKIPAHPDMVASCVVPYKVNILSLDTILNNQYYTSSLESYPMPDDSIPGDTIVQVHNYNFQLTFIDPANQQNYYKLEAYDIYKRYIMESHGWWINLEFNNTDLWFTYLPVFENVSSNTYIEPYFSDKLINGTKQILNLQNGWGSDSLIYVNLVSISKSYYDRLKSEDLFETYTYSQLAAPVEMYSNFTNAVGFLAGRTVSSDTIKMQTFIHIEKF